MKKNIRMIVDRMDREIGKIIEAVIDLNHDPKAAQSKIWNNLCFLEYDIEEIDLNGWHISMLQEEVKNAKSKMSDINSLNIRKILLGISRAFASDEMLTIRRGLMAI